MTFFTVEVPSIDVVRANAPLLLSPETVVFPERGSFYFKLNDIGSGNFVSVWPDSSLVDYGNVNILADATSIFEMSLLQAAVWGSREFLAVAQTTFLMYTDNALMTTVGSIKPGWYALIESISTNSQWHSFQYLNEYYIRIDGAPRDGINSETMSTLGSPGPETPNVGRALVVPGLDGTQRDAAWGDWLDVYQLDFGTDDEFSGTPDSDTFDGGNGIDRVDFSSENGPNGILVNLSDDARSIGNFNIDAGSGRDTYGSHDRFIAIEHIRASKRNDILVGNAENNRFEGRSGDDILFGENGDDTLLGEHGSDILIGGCGSDILMGDWGNDSLDGGAGADSAVFLGARTAYSISTFIGGDGRFYTQVANILGMDGSDTSLISRRPPSTVSRSDSQAYSRTGEPHSTEGPSRISSSRIWKLEQ